MILAEVAVPSARRIAFDPVRNEEGQLLTLDILEEHREDAQIRAALYRERIARHFNSKVKNKSFTVGELVLRLKQPGSRDGALGANWEGPFIISKVLGNGSYLLSTSEGQSVPRAWNASTLKKYYM